MNEIFTHDLMAYDGLKILQKADTFRFSLDSLLLADFVEVNQRAKKLLELGCGAGAILLYLSLKTSIKLYGVDIQKEVIDLAKESIKINKLGNQIEVFNHNIKDIQTHFTPSSFDVVVSNPPFFKVKELKMINQKESLSLSRHELSITFKEILEATKKMLKTSGALYLIHRANRLEEIIKDLQEQRFVIKRLRFVYTKPGNEALMVLVEARYNGKLGSIKILEPLYVYNQEGEYTEEIKRIFHLGDENYVKKS
ncbi:MAG: tRNA1(Val) (adenine(37)-N6)-methyltransferase [Candidatus Izemoplasmatales bacterium]|nr:tRNA1(Val) (adenine(37)-N6)-methyltransferase [Candidatus Izemoplasmatales bacterium]